jgi:hypothetical protein
MVSSHLVRGFPSDRFFFLGLLLQDHPLRGGNSAATRQPTARRLAPDSSACVYVMSFV